MDSSHSVSEVEYLAQSGNVELKEGINIKNFLTGQTFEINFDKIDNDIEDTLPPQEDEIREFIKINMDIGSDEEDNISTNSFDEIAVKMVNVTEDGKIKKKLRQEGVHNCPPENSVVSILYCSYLEFNDEPIDFAHLKRPYQFRLGTAGIIGLNYAVESMKVNEISYFLIYPDYAFGSMGHPPRIPPKATFLFRIELLRYSDSGDALNFDKLTLEDKKNYSVAYKTALALMESAKEHLKINARLAIRNYNRALDLIEECNLKNIEEQEEQQKLKLRLLTNLAICYNKENLPKKACCMCNDIFKMVKNTSLTIPAKVYFNNGRALFMIGEYYRAKEKLLIAQKLEPQNSIISDEILKINAKIQKDKQKEQRFAKIYLQSNDEVKEAKDINENVSDGDVDESFRQTISRLCNTLIKSDETKYTLPNGLTTKERNAAKMEAEKLGLKLIDNNNNTNLLFYITKK